MRAEPSLLGVSEPKQLRSRKSFAKVRSAVLQLLVERGTGQFSLAEVSASAGVSIGSIYGRVGSKAELLRAVQAEEFDRLDAETTKRLLLAGAGSGTLESAVSEVVMTFAGILHDNASLLAPFFRLSSDDEAIMARGSRSGALSERAFCDALARVTAQHGLDLEPTSSLWCHEIVYSICSRHFGFGIASLTPASRLTWSTLADELTLTINLYIASLGGKRPVEHGADDE